MKDLFGTHFRQHEHIVTLQSKLLAYLYMLLMLRQLTDTRKYLFEAIVHNTAIKKE